MIKKLSTLLAVAVTVALLSTASSAWAQGIGCHYWSYPYSADLTPLYSVGAIPTPPYFALHPPVYYSTPVPRAYGYGPWAYPPYVTLRKSLSRNPRRLKQFVPAGETRGWGPETGDAASGGQPVLPDDRRAETALATRDPRAGRPSPLFWPIVLGRYGLIGENKPRQGGAVPTMRRPFIAATGR